MKNITIPEDRAVIVARIEQLNPNTPALWGKMDVAQMLSHCREGLKLATGELQLKRLWLGYLLGPLIKSTYYNDKPFIKNVQTAKEIKITSPVAFEASKQELLNALEDYTDKQALYGEQASHPFLGHLTTEQWGKGMYKHLDHHLRQFGV
ncbi:MAG: DUF1569 domain-containing protein [Aureispira sp.]